MTRRCSQCSNNGHNSRTCPDRGVKIFGVRFDEGSSIRKSASMGNLSHYGGFGRGGSPAVAAEGGDEREKDGYASEDFVKGRERKKGVAWTEEEHKMFLLGLHQLGKGDWRGIARKYVVSRTATQVASHAQKYFNRQNHANKRKRRSSLFDMVPEEVRLSFRVPLKMFFLPLNCRKPSHGCSYSRILLSFRKLTDCQDKRKRCLAMLRASPSAIKNRRLKTSIQFPYLCLQKQNMKQRAPIQAMQIVYIQMLMFNTSLQTFQEIFRCQKQCFTLVQWCILLIHHSFRSHIPTCRAIKQILR